MSRYERNSGCSFNTFLFRRIEGRCSSVPFTNSTYRRMRCNMNSSGSNHVSSSLFTLYPSTRIIIPNNNMTTTTVRTKTTSSSSSIQSTMDLCNLKRFLLCGSEQGGIIRIYDLSKWGTKKNQQITNTFLSHSINSDRVKIGSIRSSSTNDHGNCIIYEPIQQGQIPRRGGVHVTHDNMDQMVDQTGSTGGRKNNDNLSQMIATQWYPVDSGAFVTATRGYGRIHIWDTNTMECVTEIRPYQYENMSSSKTSSYSYVSRTNSGTRTSNTTSIPISCFEICSHPSNHMLAVTGSDQSDIMKIIDFRSGSSSHTFRTGGNSGEGIVSVKWSPTQPNCFASGSTTSLSSRFNHSSNVALWDIRKPSSTLACLTILSQEYQPLDPTVSNALHEMVGTITSTSAQPVRKKQSRIMEPIQQQNFNDPSVMNNNPNGGANNNNQKKRKIMSKLGKLKSQHMAAGTTNMSRSLLSRQIGFHHHHHNSNDHVQPIPPYSSPVSTTSTVRPVSTTTITQTGGGPINGIQFHPSGHTLIHSCQYNGTLHVWDLRTGVRIPRRYTNPEGGPPVTSTPSDHHHCTPTPLHFMEHGGLHNNNNNNYNSSTDTTILWTTKGRTIYGYDYDTGGSPKYILNGHLGTGTIRSLIVDSNNGPGRIISAGSDGLILVWKCQQQRQQKEQQKQRQQQRKQKQTRSSSSSSRTFTSLQRDVDDW